MNVKNYTSATPVQTSMSKIEYMLVQIGASDINKQYKDKICTGITFLYYDAELLQTFPFHLSADVTACFNVFWKEVKRPHADTKQKLMDQAARTAWKIVSDLIELQCTNILLGQAKPLQMFLANAWDVKKQKTIYQLMVDGDLKLLN